MLSAKIVEKRDKISEIRKSNNYRLFARTYRLFARTYRLYKNKIFFTINPIFVSND